MQPTEFYLSSALAELKEWQEQHPQIAYLLDTVADIIIDNCYWEDEYVGVWDQD